MTQGPTAFVTLANGTATTLNPFPGFGGEIRVARGDVTGDGVADLIFSASAPNGHVKVFDGATGAEVRSYFAMSTTLVQTRARN